MCLCRKESNVGLFDKAKDFVSDPDNVAKAKEQMTEENVGSATDKLKEFAPDQADGAIDSLGERATAWGGGGESAEQQGGGQEQREGRGEGGRGEGGHGEARHGRHGGGDRD